MSMQMHKDMYPDKYKNNDQSDNKHIIMIQKRTWVDINTYKCD